MSLVSNKRSIEDLDTTGKLDITEDLDKILEKYDEDKVSDEFIIEMMELIRDTLSVNYNKDEISMMEFNEFLMYKNTKYKTFYELYKRFNPKVIVSNRFIKKMEILKRNIDPIKKGNRCMTCKFPFIYVINTQIYKVCIVCRKLEMLRNYYMEHNDKLIEELYVNIMKEVAKINTKQKSQRERDKLLKKLKLIIENLE